MHHLLQVVIDIFLIELDQRGETFQDANFELIISLGVLIEAKNMDGVGRHVVENGFVARHDQHVDSIDDVGLHRVGGLRGGLQQVEDWLNHALNDRHVGVLLEKRGAVLNNDRDGKN